jgi:hypothetical protein
LQNNVKVVISTTPAPADTSGSNVP